MKRYFPIFNLMLVFGLAILMLLSPCLMDPSALAQEKSSGEAFKLPPPRYESEVSIEKALLERRSIRSYKEEPLTLPSFLKSSGLPRALQNPREACGRLLRQGGLSLGGLRPSRKCNEPSGGDV